MASHFIEVSFSREVRIWAWEKIKESMKIYLLAVMTGRRMAARPMEGRVVVGFDH